MTTSGQNDFNVWDRLWRILDAGGDELLVYVYRIDRRGQVMKPHLVKCEAWPGLPQMLRDEYGGGHFQLLIKNGRKMAFSGRIAIVEWGPPRRRTLP